MLARATSRGALVAVDAASPLSRIARDSESTLLLVDDDATPRCLALQERHGAVAFSRVLGGGVGQALKLAHMIRPELGVFDIRLRCANGIQLIGRLRELCPGIGILVFTSYGSIATAVAATKSSADDYLVKPASVEELINVLLASGPSLPSLERPMDG